MLEQVTLKDDFSFVVSNRAGDVVDDAEGNGFYRDDTRYLSLLELSLNGQPLQALSYTPEYNLAATFRLSSHHQVAAASSEQAAALAPDWTYLAHALGVLRQRWVRQGLFENIVLTSYYNQPLTVTLSLRVAADFADIFEVRGFPRLRRDTVSRLAVGTEGQSVEFACLPKGAGAAPIRTIRLESEPRPTRTETGQYRSTLNGLDIPQVTLFYELELLPQQPRSLHLRFLLDGPREKAAVSFGEALHEASVLRAAWKRASTRLETSDYGLNRIFETSLLDLRALMQHHPQGLAITAGLPWYFTLFGRDSLITALQTLGLNPQIAVDTLRVLAAHQATERNDWQDSEPGKILHELRHGDMTRNGEMPHGPYYGSVDGTLLFILLFAESLKWIAEPEAFFREMWPSVQKALGWAEATAKLDEGGYITFSRRSGRGILHQGWKDSDESMGGADGPRPRPPLALVEVQGYYYAAQVALAQALRRWAGPEEVGRAADLEERAATLKLNFNRDFWWPEEGFLVQALDGDKQPVRSVTSNPGHALWSGIVDNAIAPQLVRRLLQADMLSGWGVRTMSTLDANYNPMSYHNGSIWPHDNALLVAGLSRYGFGQEAWQVAEQILAAAATFPQGRLPELYCGFERTPAESGAPCAYPVSCSPQAWAAGTPWLLLQSLLGLQVGPQQKLIFSTPVLTTDLGDLALYGVRCGSARYDLTFERDPQIGKVAARPLRTPL